MTLRTQANPSVSVCMPVFNGANFIQPAIDSMLAQTFIDWELIIIDNASTDRTVELVSAYDDPRIRLLANETNKGFLFNWNRCLQEAQGEFVKLLPADDVIEPMCLEIQIAALRAEPRAAMVSCRRTIIDEAGRRIGLRGGAKEALWTSQDAIRMIVRSGSNPIGEPGAVLFRRESATAAGTFDGQSLYVIDVDYWVRLLEAGMLITLKKPLASFRVSKISTSVLIKSNQAADYWNWVQRMSARLPFLRPWDLWMARVMSQFNQIARAIFYKVVVR